MDPSLNAQVLGDCHWPGLSCITWGPLAMAGVAFAALGSGHVSGDASFYGAEEPRSVGGCGEEVGGSKGGTGNIWDLR